jgi:hypothetical protein
MSGLDPGHSGAGPARYREAESSSFVNARRHRFLAGLVLLALAFSQLAVAAFACPIADGSTPWTDMRSAQPMADCEGMPAKPDAAPNVCEAHCLVGTQMQADARILAPLAIVSPLFLRAVVPSSTFGDASVRADSPLPTPPPLLLFARRLI